MNGSPPPCPICARPRDPVFRPFCSKRCSDVDLNRWLKGVYVIPDSASEESEDEGGRPPAAGP